MTVELQYWGIDKFVEYARNPRINDHAVDKMAAVIKEFGFRVPILAKSDGLVVDGHLRLKAAKKLKLETVPVMLADDMTETQIKAFRIAVNKSADFAQWDLSLLALEIEDLRLDDFDLDLTGFELGELDDMFGNVSQVEMPELKSGEKDPYQQKTFTLHDDQAATVDNALTLARTNPLSDTGLNENSNGNALALICEQWLKLQNGNG